MPVFYIDGNTVYKDCLYSVLSITIEKSLRRISVIKCEIANHMCCYLITSTLSNYNGYIHNDFIRWRMYHMEQLIRCLNVREFNVATSKMSHQN